jgi:hypothetical protein
MACHVRCDCTFNLGAGCRNRGLPGPIALMKVAGNKRPAQCVTPHMSKPYKPALYKAPKVKPYKPPRIKSYGKRHPGLYKAPKAR